MVVTQYNHVLEIEINVAKTENACEIHLDLYTIFILRISIQ